MEFEKTIEQETCLNVLNLSVRDAIKLIRENDLTFHVLEQDGKFLKHNDPCYISDRINLIVRRGRVIGTEIG